MLADKKLIAFSVISLSFIISTLVILIILETTLIVFDKGRQLSDGDYGWSTWASGNENLFKAFLGPSAAELYVPHYNEINQFGFRGKPMEDSPMNIVLLGDSNVETSHPLNKMPERHLSNELEQKIGFMPNVISMGSWGWGTDQQYLALKQHIDDINPSHVLLWFISNDYKDNTYPWGNSGRKPTFWLSDNELQGPNHQFLEEFQPEKFRLTRLLERRELLGPNLDQDKGFYKKYVEPNIMPMEAIKPCSDGIDFDLTMSDWSSRFAEPRPNWLEYQKNLTRELLLRTKTLAESRGSKFSIFYVRRPDYGNPNLNLPMTTICSKEFGEVTYAHENFDKLIEETFQGTEHYYIDLASYNPSMKLTSADYGDKFDGHFNDEFVKYIMKEVANIIEKDRLDGNN